MINIVRSKYLSFFTFIGLSSLFTLMFLALPVVTGDTYELIAASNNLVACISDLNSNYCLELERFGFTPHLISALLLQIFPNVDVVIVLWSILNYILCIFIISIIYKIYYSINSVPTSNIFFIGTAFSPMIAYGVYSFSELTFIFLSLFCLKLLFENKQYLAIIPGILAIAYKDNAFVTLVPLALAILLITKSSKKSYFLLSLTTITGILINWFFSYIRYQSLTEGVYQDTGVVIDPITNLNNLVAVWLSPSGGVLGYFFILPMILIIILINSFRSNTKRQFYVVLLLLLPVILINLNLALWYSPFGWIGWGPRLFLPTIILFIFSVFLFFKSTNVNLDKFLSPVKLFIYYLINYIMFLSVAGFLINPAIWKSWYQKNSEAERFCQDIPRWEDFPNEFILCNNKMMWSLDSLTYSSFYEVALTIRLFFESGFIKNSIFTMLILLITVYFIVNLLNDLGKVKNKLK